MIPGGVGLTAVRQVPCCASVERMGRGGVIFLVGVEWRA